MSRADVPEDDRRPFYLYVDEFQNFTNVDSLSSILSEARKYRLALTLAHQYTAQIGEELRAAVFGNVGTIVCLRVGFEDARLLAEQLDPLSPTVSRSSTRTAPGCGSSTAVRYSNQPSCGSRRPTCRGGGGGGRDLGSRGGSMRRRAPSSRSGSRPGLRTEWGAAPHEKALSVCGYSLRTAW